jgi:hypothetical protein
LSCIRKIIVKNVKSKRAQMSGASGYVAVKRRLKYFHVRPGQGQVAAAKAVPVFDFGGLVPNLRDGFSGDIRRFLAAPT